jgi:diketogulonate reductase-like aldo/keto reductase
MQTINANGAAIPALGFGTFRLNEAQVLGILPRALQAGFRHIDTAQIYQNEAGVGAVLKKSGIPRADIFLTTKVWPTEFAPKRFRASVEQSLRRLQTDYVDLLLLHWPGGSKVPREVQIAELNDVLARGMTRHIGLSNYTSTQMSEAASLSKAPLVTNQVEYHPYLSQTPVLARARELGMSITAYFAMADGRSVKEPLLKEIGARHGKSAAQVALRWLLQQPNVVALSRTARPERLDENLSVFDFALSEDEMNAIFALAEPNGRIVAPADLAPRWDGQIGEPPRRSLLARLRSWL